MAWYANGGERTPRLPVKRPGKRPTGNYNGKEGIVSMASTNSRILNPTLAQRVMSAEEAAALIAPGSILGMSGFTGSGYPKAVPTALAKRMEAARENGQGFKVSVFTGASTGPELDGALAKAHGINLRLPYS